MTDKPTDTFCAVPWVAMSTKPNGTARVCCLMYSHYNQGIINDEHGTPYNYRDASFDDIINGQMAREVRLSLLQGIRHPSCATCWVKEDAGSNSRRLQTNKIYSNEFTLREAREYTDEEGYSRWQPSYYDLRFGNLCNLKCVMCHPSSSSQWYDDYVLLNGATSYNDGGTVVQMTKQSNGKHTVDGTYDWWQSSHFWQQLEDKIPFMKQIYLVGGEPMLIEPHYEFLGKIIASGRAGEITLEYDTNMTAVHYKALDLWKHFKAITLRISLEDYGIQNDYIRFPSKWTAIEKNIGTIRASKLDNIELSFSTTWQILNSYTICQLLDWYHENGFQYHVRILNSPSNFDVKVLPVTAKSTLIDIYEKWAGDDAKKLKNISVLVNYLRSTKDYDDMRQLHSFKNTVDRLDSARGTDWRATFPRLQEALDL